MRDVRKRYRETATFNARLQSAGSRRTMSAPSKDARSPTGQTAYTMRNTVLFLLAVATGSLAGATCSPACLAVRTDTVTRYRENGTFWRQH